MTRKALVVIGASGVGKGTIISHLFKKHDSILSFTISFTTRSPRPNQINNVHYRFVTHEEFQGNIPKMLEHKLVFGNYYGTCKAHVDQIWRSDRIPVLDIDIQGMLQIRRKIACEVLCIMPPSLDILRQRLSGRNSQTKESLEKRMVENQEQLKKMYQLEGQKDISFVKNYQYQLTGYGVEKWMCKKFDNFNKYFNGKYCEHEIAQTKQM